MRTGSETPQVWSRPNLKGGRVYHFIFFDAIQPLTVTADQMLVKDRDVITVRDYLWREIVIARAAIQQKISDEKIEYAYKDLYGYDPRIQELYTAAIQRLKDVNAYICAQALYQAQNHVLSQDSVNLIPSSRLGNAIRETGGELSEEADVGTLFIKHSQA